MNTTSLTTMYAVCAFLLGACFGSFAALIIFRMPRGISIVMPRSFCASCETPLNIWHNLPIISWLILRGRCGFCRASIGIRPWIIEVIMATGFLAIYWKFGFSIAGAERAALLFVLVCLTYIDLDTFSLPISLLIALFVIGGISSTLYMMMPDTYVAPSQPISLLSLMVFNPLSTFSLIDRFIGCGVGFFSLALINIFATMILRRRQRLLPDQWAMGFGDAVMLSAIGLFVGVRYLVLIVFIASACGSAVGIIARLRSKPSTDREIAEGALPYGPFLAIAAIYVYLF